MQELKLRIKGLHVHGNDLSAVPEGALTVADNIVIDREEIAEPRRGYNRGNVGFSDVTYRASKLFFYQDYLFAAYSTNLLAYYSTVLDSASAEFTDTGSWTSVGTYAAPSGTKMRVAESNQNLYFTTDAGVMKLDAFNATPKHAGAYKGVDLQASLGGTTGGWLNAQEKVAYRVLWGYKDANSNLILGAPSQREVLKNTNAEGTTAEAVSLDITIPQGVTTEWFYQVYRSAAVDASSAAVTVDPSDELGLVYEGNPSSAEVTAGTLSITDQTPDELRGATIYTAATPQGLVNQNEQPPLAKDVAVFKNTMFYANTTSKHRYYLTLLAVEKDGSPGLEVADTVTIGGVEYIAGASEDVSTRTFAVSTDDSAAIRIRDTALSLVRAINQITDSTTLAFYLSGEDDLPGKLLIEAESLSSAGFTVASSRESCWSPSLATDGSSTNDRYKHGVYYSKVSEPEAVPLGNFFLVGSAQHEILRIVPLRDSLFIFKQDGIYRLSGEDSSTFRVDLFDSSTHLLAAESVAVLNNQIFCFTDQGVVAVTEAGVQVKSRPIESALTALLGINASVLKSESFGVAYETERKYILFVPSAASDTKPSQAYVYNTFTDTWTRWTLAKTCGVVNPNTDCDKLYLGDADSEYVNEERKNFNYKDYADYDHAATITAVDGTVVTITSPDTISVGDLILESENKYALVTEINTAAGTVTVQTAVAFTEGGTVSVYKSVATRIAWVPVTSGNPGSLKHYREVTLMFKSDFTGNASLLFKSDVSPGQEAETLVGTEVGLWGLFAWGGVPWGGTAARRPIRVYVPRNKQRCSQLTVEFRHSTAYAAYQLNGVSIIANPGSERVSV